MTVVRRGVPRLRAVPDPEPSVERLREFQRMLFVTRLDLIHRELDVLLEVMPEYWDRVSLRVDEAREEIGHALEALR